MIIGSEINGKAWVTSNGHELIQILYRDIVKIYSDGKYNYCKTKENKYKIKGKLYELEELDDNFIRISKKCIVNIIHVKIFDIGETGKIIIRLDDDTEEIVSRRKMRLYYPIFRPKEDMIYAEITIYL